MHCSRTSIYCYDKLKMKYLFSDFIEFHFYNKTYIPMGTQRTSERMKHFKSLLVF